VAQAEIVAFHIAISYDTQWPRYNGRAVMRPDHEWESVVVVSALCFDTVGSQEERPADKKSLFQGR